MNSHVDDYLPELVMGVLLPEEERTVCMHLKRCAKCTANWVSLEEASTSLARILSPVGELQEMRERVLQSVDSNNTTHS